MNSKLETLISQSVATPLPDYSKINDGAEQVKSTDGANQVFESLTHSPMLQRSLCSRKCHSDCSCRTEIFRLIQELIKNKVGVIVSADQEKFVFDVTEKFCEHQDTYFRTSQYNALISKMFKDTKLPSLIMASKIIPTACRGNSERQIVLTLQADDNCYAHTFDGKEVPIRIAPFFVKYNPDALTEPDTSMLHVDMCELGYSDGNPRYIFTTRLYPCICVTFFDKSQSKSLLGHFTAGDFTFEKLSKIFEFCEHQNMKNLECHIVGGRYEYLGVDNGFLNLRQILFSKGIPIRQMFVGDPRDRPVAVVLDTKDMTLYGLPFKTLNRSGNWLEEDELKLKLPKIADMTLLTKNFTSSLLTCSFDA